MLPRRRRDLRSLARVGAGSGAHWALLTTGASCRHLRMSRMRWQSARLPAPPPRAAQPPAAKRNTSASINRAARNASVSTTGTQLCSRPFPSLAGVQAAACAGAGRRLGSLLCSAASSASAVSSYSRRRECPRSGCHAALRCHSHCPTAPAHTSQVTLKFTQSTLNTSPAPSALRCSPPACTRRPPPRRRPPPPRRRPP